MRARFNRRLETSACDKAGALCVDLFFWCPGPREFPRIRARFKESGVSTFGILTVFLLAWIAGPGLSLDQPRITRKGSNLSIQWSSNNDGQWKLRTSKGYLCASGVVAQGRNDLIFEKIASPEALNLQITLDGDTRHEFSIDPLHDLSTLAQPRGAAVIYQVPIRSYVARGVGETSAGKIASLTGAVLQEIRDLGVDYLWVTGVLEHASLEQTDHDVVKGGAGSYYAIYDNWDVSKQIGGLQEFENLIARAHEVGLRILIDFVPNHTSRVHRTDVTCKQGIDFGSGDQQDRFFDSQNNYFYIQQSGFSPPPRDGMTGSDGIFDTDIFSPGIQWEDPAKVTGNDINSPTPHIHDWFETAKINYGHNFVNRENHYDPRPRTWDLMLDIALYWIEKGVDGFRVDYAHSVPLEFWQFFTDRIRRVNPNAFLLAEAYESDQRMRVPGFTYQKLFEAGFDSIYNSTMYWALRNQATQPGTMRATAAAHSPSDRQGILRGGFSFTHYMENHDEVRVASRHFAPFIGSREARGNLGLAYTAFLGLRPGHLLLHGGQELQEDARVFGDYAGDNGRTSIFDFVYQSQTRSWLYGDRAQWMIDFRERYKNFLRLKKSSPFNLPDTLSQKTFYDLDSANWYKDQSRFIGAYVRMGEGAKYLVVLNSDPFAAHEAVIHFVNSEMNKQLLNALDIEDSDKRYQFYEVFSRPGFEPEDPNVDGEGIPGFVLHRHGGIPSGLFLGEVPPATTYVFAIRELENIGNR